MQADPKVINRLLKTAMGQLQGVQKMVEEDRYCIDISNQLLAVTAILQKANKEIIRAHMRGCVREAFESGDPEAKIDELLKVFDKMTK
ncbi:metal-sensing transcriptional repressor [Caproicibacterium sp. NSD3]|jgi:DNA-binding FrmR family transcriptional regulator